MVSQGGSNPPSPGSIPRNGNHAITWRCLVTPYIYKITNSINGKAYIGKTMGTPEKRFKEHIADSKRDRYANRPLYKAF